MKNDEARRTKDEGMTKSKNSHEGDDSFWLDDEMTVVREEPEKKPVYDLEERTARFGEAVIDFREGDSARPDNESNRQSVDRRGNECWRKLC
jgi:hypothetical protein